MGGDHAALDVINGVHVVDTIDRTFVLRVGGKIERRNKHVLKTRDDVSMAGTPGLARVCQAIAEDCDKDKIYEFFFCGPPLIITGATGSPINPQAIK